MYGYAGRILRVDLTTRTYSIEQPDETFYRTYGGGRGMIAYYLLREVPADVDPLGPNNLLIFATGPTTGLPITGSSRHSVGAKSPLTGGYGDAEAGGFWGHELKLAGWDALIVAGQASEPLYLYIEDDRVEFRPAGELWGQEVFEATEAIRQAAGDNRVRVAAIGPAGERRVRIACVMHDCRSAAGRTGLGAVMGSKLLKAVAVRGHGHTQVANEAAVKESTRWISDNVGQVAGWLGKLGTGQHLRVMSLSGNLPVRNYQGGFFPTADNLSVETMVETGLLEKMEGCFACTARCKKKVSFAEPAGYNSAYGGPEYETLGAFGSDCGIDDLKAVCLAHAICNAQGMDTISAGCTIAFAMDLFERGLLTEAETGGLALNFGNADAMLTMLQMMARREGLGDLLAEGSRRAAAKIGRGSEAFLVEVKGQEAPMHEPRLKAALGLGYAVSPTGADHNHNMHDNAYTADGWGLDELRPLGILEGLPSRELSPAKVRMFAYVHLSKHLHDVLDICGFIAWPLDRMARLITAVTGWKTNEWELLKMAERAVNLTRMFNLASGLTAADDRLPARYFEPHPDGALSDHGMDRAEVSDAIHGYYGMMGWDPATGVPTAGKLDELNIRWAEAYLPS